MTFLGKDNAQRKGYPLFKNPEIWLKKEEEIQKTILSLDFYILKFTI